MHFQESISDIVGLLNSTDSGKDNASVWSMMVADARKSDSLRTTHIYLIESKIKHQINKLNDDEKIELYNTSESGFTDPVEPDDAIISHIEFVLESELLEAITDILFTEAGQNRPNSHCQCE